MVNYDKLNKIGKLYFGYEDIAKVLGIGPASARVEAHRFVRYGILLRIKRNLYILRSVWQGLSQEERFAVANIIQVPSYVSFMSALEYYGITTQVLRDFVESVSQKRTKEVSVDDVIFNYSRIKKKLYFGFVRKSNFFIAEPEKAFLDGLYMSLLGRYKFDISSIDFDKFDLKKLRAFSRRYPKKVKDEVEKYV